MAKDTTINGQGGAGDDAEQEARVQREEVENRDAALANERDDADQTHEPPGRQEGADDDGDGQPQPTPPTLTYEDKGARDRDLLAKKISAKRQGKVFDEDTGQIIEPDQAPAAVQQTPTPQQRQAATSEEDAREVTLVVDGTEIKLPFARVKAIAQTNIAADQRLAAAKQYLADAAASAGRTRQPDAGAQNQGEQQAEQAPSGQGQRNTSAIDPKDLESYIDRIQTGTPEEGSEALAEAFTNVLARVQPQPADVGSQVAAQLFIRDEQGATNRAVEILNKELPANLTALDRDALEGQAIREMIADMRNAGVPENELEMAARAPREKVMLAHMQLRLERPDLRVKMRGREDIAKATVSTFRAWKGLPASDPPSPSDGQRQSDRTGRLNVDTASRDALKGGLTQQPRSAQRSGGPTPMQQPRTASDVMKKMASQSGRTLAS